MILYLAGDVRWSGPHTQPADFLGQRYRFSATWVSLSCMTGAPVVPVFCNMLPQGRYQVGFHPAFPIPSGATDNDQVQHLVQTFLSLLEDQVRLNPSNSNDYFFWPKADADQLAA